MQQPSDEQLHRHLLGQADTAEELQIHAWRAGAPEHESMYQAYVSNWHAFDPQDADFDVDAGWEKLSRRLGFDEPVVVPFPKRRALPTWVGVLAAALILSLTGVLVFQSQTSSWTTVTTLAGEMKTIDLPDGSRVVLAGGGSIRFPESFGEDLRPVRLEGRAFFDVVKNAATFEVTTGTARVQVLGTRFDVWTGDQKVIVRVEEGRVALSSDETGNRVELGVGQQGELVDGRHAIPVREITSAQIPAWIDGKLLFDRQLIHDVMLDLERFFGQPLRLDATVGRELTLTAAYEGEDLETILREICLSLNLEMTQEEEGYFIRAR